MQEPRGIRNNNPLNIRKGNHWKGERPDQTDPIFEEFVSMEYGIRAGLKLLRNYITGFDGRSTKFDTVYKIVARWAPPSENATQKYIDFVCQELAISPFETVSFADRKTIIRLARTMAFVECGQWIDQALFESAYDML